MIPAFYQRGGNGIPAQWVSRMRESMARLTPRFSANRSVREYTEAYYLPTARAYGERARNRGAAGLSMLKWQQDVLHHWANVRFGELRVGTSGAKHTFDIQVYLGELAPETVCVQLYGDSPEGGVPMRQEMVRGRSITGAVNGYIYSAEVPAQRPSSHYTPRIVPSPLVGRVPLEDAHILWFR